MAYIKCIRNLVSSTVPDGKTVTPTDDISIWLACGGRSEAYTTLAEILNDAICLAALISDSNAIDYLVRSTTWASGITADSSAMSYIGLDNYASNTLLADSTWRSAIFGSTYRESVLNVKVPAMTGYTTPSGEVIYNSDNIGEAWKAFDNDWNKSTAYDGRYMWITNAPSNGYAGYDFSRTIKLVGYAFRDATYNYGGETHHTISTYKIQYHNGNDWQDATDQLTNTYAGIKKEFTIPNVVDCSKVRLYDIASSSNVVYCGAANLQFYGRVDV